MQNIINKIQSGELSQVQLIDRLVTYHSTTLNEYDEACDVVENNQEEIKKLEADKTRLEHNIKLIADQGLKAVAYTAKLESENIRLKADSKEIKQLRNDNKSLKKLKVKHAESSKKQMARIESLTKDCRDYRKEIAINKSDIARLRLTGFKEIGKYNFTIFPSKTNITEGGKIEKQVNLVIMDKAGNMKILGVNQEGVVTQPRSHNFKLEDEHVDFITSFDRIARDDGYQFTDRVLKLVN